MHVRTSLVRGVLTKNIAHSIGSSPVKCELFLGKKEQDLWWEHFLEKKTNKKSRTVVYQVLNILKILQAYPANIPRPAINFLFGYNDPTLNLVML